MVEENSRKNNEQHKVEGCLNIIYMALDTNIII